jgi:APA family basic amino acid/polyamine antiporter
MNNKTKKPLGIWRLTALVTGTMIGSGIFLLPANLARIGNEGLLSWIITAIGAFVLAIIFSKLSIIIPKNGGPYAYAKAGLGNFVGFQTVFNYWISLWITNVGLALITVVYLANFWPVLLNPIIGSSAALIMIWLLTLINVYGVRPAGNVQLVTTILKIIPILAIILFGIWHFHLSYILSATTPSYQHYYTSISSAAGITLWAFIGIEAATVPYDFVDNPRKNIPIATILGTLIAATIYIASSTIIMGILPPHILAKSAAPFISTAELLFGHFGKWMMIFGAAISCFGCINGITLLQGQVAMAAADDKLFPTIFSLRNKAGVPGWGLITTAVLESVLLILIIHQDIYVQFRLIILLASLAALIPYLYTAAAASVVLRQGTMQLANYKKYAIIACIGGLYSLWMIISSGYEVVYHGCILLFVSALLFAWSYKKL